MHSGLQNKLRAGACLVHSLRKVYIDLNWLRSLAHDKALVPELVWQVAGHH